MFGGALRYLDKEKPTQQTFLIVDQANISVGFESTFDVVSHFSSNTGKEALDELLLISNSIVYIKNRVVHVAGRDPSAELKYTYYGPASQIGLENIISMSDIKTGLSKTFNFWTWGDETFNVSNSSSIDVFGIKKNSVNAKSITNTTKQQNILASLSNEFDDPKESFKLKVEMNYETMELFFLDKVNIDYPTVYISTEGDGIPVYNVSKYDQAVYPIPESVLTIDINRRFKILGVNIDVKNQTIEHNLKEV